MGIEISGLQGKPVQNSGENRQITSTKAASNRSSGPTAKSKDDSFSLTDSATKLQALATQVAQLPMVDMEIVDETQNAINTGSFEFEPVDAAENLLTQEQELASLEN